MGPAEAGILAGLHEERALLAADSAGARLLREQVLGPESGRLSHRQHPHARAGRLPPLFPGEPGDERLVCFDRLSRRRALRAQPRQCRGGGLGHAADGDHLHADERLRAPVLAECS